MPTYVHFVRHAQGHHNLAPANHSLPDPDLTDLGKEQCAQLQKTFPFHSQITHLVASPLRRTIYTCLLSFEPALRNAKGDKRKVVALPDLQEISPLPCDTGSDPAALAAEFGPAGHVDLALVADGWNNKGPGSPYAPTMPLLEARARRARRWLRDLGRAFERDNPGVDAHIVAVTHGGFLHFLTQDWDGMRPDTGTGWQNTEWRSYEFVDEGAREGGEGEEEDEARLRETNVSWRRRRGSAVGLTETEQMELRIVIEKSIEAEWGANGENGKKGE